MTSAMSDGAATIGRGGVAIAMTTGLAASVGLPTAAAAGQNAAAASPAQAASSANLASQALALTALPRSVTSGAPVSAAAGAKVTFAAKQAAFTAVPKPKPKPVVKPLARASTNTSRSTTRTSSSTTTTQAQAPSTNLSGVLAIAARYVGVPYVYGGESPGGFDCSGYSQYVFKQVGISLPRTSSQQYAAVTHISRSEAKPGDLVFFLSGGSVYHLGIYAGGGMMYDAPKPGGAVSKRAIWSATTAYGRP